MGPAVVASYQFPFFPKFCGHFSQVSIVCLGAKSATGLLEWSDVDMALDAFVITNHTTVYAQSKEREREREREGRGLEK